MSGSKFNIAEASRPFRDFKKKKENYEKVTAPKILHTRISAIRTNWFTPFLWQHIIWAGNHCKPQMSPSEIVKMLKLKFPLLFGSLTSQVVGRWIDRTASTPQWSAKVLKLAEAGNHPQSHHKHAGILVRRMQSIYVWFLMKNLNRTHTPSWLKE